MWPAFTTRSGLVTPQVLENERRPFPHMSAASVVVFVTREWTAGHMLKREEKQTNTWFKAPSISPCNSWGSRLYEFRRSHLPNAHMETNGHLQSDFGYVCVTGSTHWSAGVRSSNVVLMVAFSGVFLKTCTAVWMLSKTLFSSVSTNECSADVWKRANVYRSVYIQEGLWAVLSAWRRGLACRLGLGP